MGLEAGGAGPMTGVIGVLNILVAGACAGIGAEGLVGGTGCAGNNCTCCGAALALIVAAACSSLKISVSGNSA